MGRAAGYVLDQEEELERLIRIFVCADNVRRVRAVMEVDATDEERQNAGSKRWRSPDGNITSISQAANGTT